MTQHDKHTMADFSRNGLVAPSKMIEHAIPWYTRKASVQMGYCSNNSHRICLGASAHSVHMHVRRRHVYA